MCYNFIYKVIGRQNFPKCFDICSDKHIREKQKGETVMEIRDLNNIERQLSSQDIRNIDKHVGRRPGRPNFEKSGRSDEINISAEGRKTLKTQMYARIATDLPSVRSNELERVQKRMETGYYDDPSVISKTVENMLGS